MPRGQHQDAIAHRDGLLDRMRDEDHGPRHELVDAEELVLEDLPRESVERAKWLVHKEDVRFERERARKTRALLHAARELARVGALEAT